MCIFLYSFCFSKLWGVLVFMLFDLVIGDLYVKRHSCVAYLVYLENIWWLSPHHMMISSWHCRVVSCKSCITAPYLPHLFLDFYQGLVLYITLTECKEWLRVGGILILLTPKNTMYMRLCIHSRCQVFEFLLSSLRVTLGYVPRPKKQVEQSYQLKQYFGPKEFPLGPESKVWKNEAALMWHHYPTKFYWSQPKNTLFLVWETNFSSLGPILSPVLRSVLDPKFLAPGL